MRRNRRKKAGRRSGLRRAADIAGVVALFLVAAVAAAVFDELSMRSLAGQARAVDGDTIRLAGQRVRLAGIDAPELRQECRRDGVSYDCGRAARKRLAALVSKGQTECRGNERDRYGRMLMRCICAGTDINRDMVAAGWAVAYGDYEDVEGRARSDGAGLWAGQFDRPSDWREIQGALADAGPAHLASRLLIRLRSAFGFGGERSDP